jgi:hypothetical protein
MSSKGGHVTAESLHPAATHHLPSFVPAPDGTDVLMVVTGFVLLAAVVGFGILFLRLHTLPERIAHKSHKLQFEIVAVLGLISLFTHMHIFWIIGLLLALIDIPDFGGWLGRIAGSVEKIAGVKPGDASAEEVSHDAAADSEQSTAPSKISHENVATIRRSDNPAPTKPEHGSKKKEELSRA